MDLRLMPFDDSDEAEAVAAHRVMVDDGHGGFLLFYDASRPWAEFVAQEEAAHRGLGLTGGRVPSALLKAVVDGTIVGRVSVRFSLSEYLFHYGGHVGYYVLPAHRGKGYATEMLRQSLVVARSQGVGPVLLICDDHNAASAAVIERCGGVFESTALDEDGHSIVRRYWIS